MIPRSPINILYVDDEMNNLLSFKALFRLKYNIHLAQNSKEAVQALEKNAIHILLTDHRMPDITGLELLDMVSGKYSNPTAILVTGCAPEKEANEAIVHGKIYTCLSKPWDEVKLEQILNEAYAFYKLRNEGNPPITNLLFTNHYMRPQTSLPAF